MVPSLVLRPLILWTQKMMYTPGDPPLIDGVGSRDDSRHEESHEEVTASRLYRDAAMAQSAAEDEHLRPPQVDGGIQRLEERAAPDVVTAHTAVGKRDEERPLALVGVHVELPPFGGEGVVLHHVRLARVQYELPPSPPPPPVRSVRRSRTRGDASAVVRTDVVVVARTATAVAPPRLVAIATNDGSGGRRRGGSSSSRRRRPALLLVRPVDRHHRHRRRRRRRDGGVARQSLAYRRARDEDGPRAHEREAIGLPTAERLLRVRVRAPPPPRARGLVGDAYYVDAIRRAQPRLADVYPQRRIYANDVVDCMI